ncbi:glycoside hydrolase family 28 protein [Telmatobacter bradus]|uniref:glycoside hydrolase family 28 protein n=1 Tax=Telmatobacter bradus TaxID=474953 RepID=UPI003B43156F
MLDRNSFVSRCCIFAASAFVFAATLNAQTVATGDNRTISTPSFPSVCKTLTAVSTTSERSSPPSSDDTSRIQSALTSCAGTGKSVVLAAGTTDTAFYAEELTVNGEGLVISSGVTLYGGASYYNDAELILIEGSSSFLGGPGTIDGRGDLIASSGTPRLVQTSDASSLIIYDITLTQAAHPNLYIKGGSDITIDDVTIKTPATRTNADGIDIDSTSHVTVLNSYVEAGDDGIAVKTNASAASNITVENSYFYGTHGLSIGSQTMYGITNVLFSGNYVYGNDLSGNASGDANGINIKTDEECGGTVKQVTYKNTCLYDIKHLIVVNAYYGSCSGNTGTPVFDDILINGVESKASLSGAYSRFYGYSSSYPADVYLENVDLDTTTQSSDEYADVYLYNSNITPSGTDVSTSSFSGSGSVPSCSFNSSL